MRPLASRPALPEFHDDLLIVQLRPQAARAMGASFRIAAANVGDNLTTGMSALAKFERMGMIKTATPLERNAPPAPELGSSPAGAAGFRAARGVRVAGAVIGAAHSEKRSALQGATMLELEKSADIEALRRALAEDNAVLSVSRVPVRYMALRKRKTAAARNGAAIAATPPAASTMWNLQKIRWQQARARPRFAEADAIKVAIMDTGVDMKHPDLKSRVKSYVYQHPDVAGASGDRDIIGHGTHVAGTVAANIGNNLGINGVCRTKLYVWKIFADKPTLVRSAQEYVYYVDPIMYLRALVDANDAGIDVVNLSIGGPGAPSTQEREAFEDLIEGGAVVVAAMGNEREEGSPVSYPAAIQNVVAVGATTITDDVAQFSNSGNHICISAPGGQIWSTLPTYPGQFSWQAVYENGAWRQGKANRRETNYDAWDGTSMATPHVTAAVALYRARNRTATPAEVRAALENSSDKVAGMSGQPFHPDFGHGRLNLERLLTP